MAESQKIWGGRAAQLANFDKKVHLNLKVNLKCLGLYTGAKMQLVSYEYILLSVRYDFLGSVGL